MNKIFDEKNIATFKDLKDLATGNILVGRREIRIGIDERAIQELKNYIFKANMFDEHLILKYDSYEKYWKQANRNIQAYEKELREYVASLLYDNDYKNQALEEKDKEIERLNNIIDDLKKYLLERLFEYKNCKNKENINHLSFKLLILKLLDKIDECSGDDSNDSRYNIL